LSEYNLALFFHLVGVLVLVTGVGLAGVAFEVARRQEKPSEIALLLGLTRLGVLLVAAGTTLLGVFGLLLVHVGTLATAPAG
jgi:predicted membrane channel-forming protein YqfA (hemolysin III family)